MKKYIRIFVLLCIVFCMGNISYAKAAKTDAEKIGDYYFKFEQLGYSQYQLMYSLDDVTYESVDIPVFHNAWILPEYGNGRYIISDMLERLPGMPEYYLVASRIARPIYVFDKDLNLIKQIETTATMRCLKFADGVFVFGFLFAENGIPVKASSHGYCDATYITADGINWKLMSVDGCANEFDIDSCDYIDIVDTPEELYEQSLSDTAKLGEYYFKNGGYSKDGENFTELKEPQRFSHISYFDGKYFGTCDNKLYVFDSDMNIINSSEWDGEISTVYGYKGKFYVAEYLIISEKPYKSNVNYYCSDDGINWESSDEESYEIARSTQFLFNGSEYHEYRSGNNDYELLDGKPVIRELYLNNDRWLYDRHINKKLMRDGLKTVKLPWDANVDYGTREDENYVYIRRDVLGSQCYRIPHSVFESEVKVIYNGSFLAFEVAPFIEDGRTFIPLRFLFEQMGATVDWDSETMSATVKKDNDTITFSIDNTAATVNGETQIMDKAAQLVGGRTMIPLRFLVENLGYDVEWDNDNKTVVITQ